MWQGTTGTSVPETIIPSPALKGPTSPVRLRVPSGKVLAIGDHRGNSQDGRFFGFIDERELYGRAVAVYYRSEDGFVWKKL